MFLQFLVVFAILNGVFTFRIDNGENSLEPLSKLIELISKVNENDEDQNIRERTSGDITPISLDYYDFTGQNNRDDVLWEEEPPVQEVRLRVIQNPEVLEQYLNNLKEKKQKVNEDALGYIVSSRNEEYTPKIYSSISFDDIMSHIRRNGFFRVDKALNGHDEKKDSKQRFNNQEILTDIKFKDHVNELKSKNNDRRITTKKKNKGKRESKSIESDTKFGEDWFSKKENGRFDLDKNKFNPLWDDDYPQKDKKELDNKNSKSQPFEITKDLDSKPLRLDDNYKDHKPKKSNSNKELYEPIKTESLKPRKNKEFDNEPKKKIDNFKPNYKPLKSDYDEKPHKKVDNRDDNYDKPYKSNNYKVIKETKPKSPRIKKFDDYHDYKPRNKKNNHDRGGGSGGKSFGRTPIPYAGHRGVYDD